MNYDLAVAYRIYPKVSKVPPIYYDDKYKLSEFCLRSFKNSLEGLRSKIYAILDGCPPQYEELFGKYFPEGDLELIRTEKIGNQATFKLQVDTLLGQNFAEKIYFAEDDYFYFPGTFREAVDFMDSNPDAHFVSPYDHLDYYNMDLHNYESEIRAGEKRHFRTVSTTCMTFLTTKTTLAKTKSTFLSYARRNDDASMWLSLTRKRLFDPLLYANAVLNEPNTIKILGKSWVYCLPQNLLGSRWKLWTPLPTIAAHMDEKFLPPTIEWLKTFAEYQ